MSSRSEEDAVSSLERARESLYSPVAPSHERTAFSDSRDHQLPHAWGEEKPLPTPRSLGEHHVRLAGIFFGIAAVFFLISLGIAGYFLYYGSNSVSVDKVALDLQGPTTIAGGDTIPLSITITNKNPVALENATIEIDFPDGTRDAADVLKAYPRYTEKLGTLASGATITRSIKAVVFGGAGQTLTLPVIFSYGTAGSNATFEKKTSYALAVSSTPLSLSIDALTETVSGKPITFTLTVRSNATLPLENVVLTATSPFGFSITSSSIPLTNSSFLIGTLAPGASTQVTLTGTLTGQNSEQRVFHFTVGTAKSARDSSLAVTYMTQDATVMITAPFIATTLQINGSTAADIVMMPGSLQSVALSYVNTLATPVRNAIITVALSGSAIDYASIKTANGFYDSKNQTITFNQDTDPALGSLAPGASGLGSFTFSTLAAGALSPTVTFMTSVSGTRVGQTNVPEQVSSSAAKTARVMTSAQLSSLSTRVASPLVSSGPVPPRAGQTTTYAVVWNVQNKGSAIAGGTVTATLPSYVSYTGNTAGAGSFSYDSITHIMTWTVGDLLQGAGARGLFQVSFAPSTSQKGDAPVLANEASFSGYDRFAGVQVSATAPAVTTETKGDPGYVQGSGIVR